MSGPISTTPITGGITFIQNNPRKPESAVIACGEGINFTGKTFKFNELLKLDEEEQTITQIGEITTLQFKPDRIPILTCQGYGYWFHGEEMSNDTNNCRFSIGKYDDITKDSYHLGVTDHRLLFNYKTSSVEVNETIKYEENIINHDKKLARYNIEDDYESQSNNGEYGPKFSKYTPMWESVPTATAVDMIYDTDSGQWGPSGVSSRFYKENETEVGDLSWFRNVDMKLFNFKNDPNGTSINFIAEDIEAVCPEKFKFCLRYETRTNPNTHENEHVVGGFYDISMNTLHRMYLNQEIDLLRNQVAILQEQVNTLMNP